VRATHEKEAMKLLTGALERAQVSPDAPGVVYRDVELSWQELFDTSARLASLLGSRGVTVGQVVASTGFSAILQTVIVTATWFRAGISAVLPTGFLEDPLFTPDWVITPTLLSHFPVGRQIVLDDAAFGGLGAFPPLEKPVPYASEEALCHLIFSSGTTGTYKAIPYSVDRVTRRATINAGQWRSERPFLCSLGFRSAAGLIAFAESILSFRTYLIAEGPAEIVTTMRRKRVATILSSPIELASLADYLERNRVTLPALKIIQATGSSLPNSVRDRLMSLTGAQVHSFYGSSEIGFVAVGNPGDSDTGYVGEIQPDADVEIIDSEQNLVPDGEPGTVRIKRPGQPKALFVDDGTSEPVFEGGWFYPGDLGFMRGDSLFITGRRNELLNAGGVKVLASEVENAVTRFPGIRDTAALVTKTPTDIPVITALYVSAEAIDEKALQKHLSGTLGERAPRRFIRVDSIPRNDNGKILRRELRA
jgi:long-chain acyl-CoA synthetase